jgi:hypothetical protein
VAVDEEVAIHLRHRFVRHNETIAIAMGDQAAGDQVCFLPGGRLRSRRGWLACGLGMSSAGLRRGRPLPGQAKAAALDFFYFTFALQATENLWQRPAALMAQLECVGNFAQAHWLADARQVGQEILIG